jgi:hypothetical protein
MFSVDKINYYTLGFPGLILFLIFFPLIAYMLVDNTIAGILFGFLIAISKFFNVVLRPFDIPRFGSFSIGKTLISLFLISWLVSFLYGNIVINMTYNDFIYLMDLVKQTILNSQYIINIDNQVLLEFIKMYAHILSFSISTVYFIKLFILTYPIFTIIVFSLVYLLHNSLNL